MPLLYRLLPAFVVLALLGVGTAGWQALHHPPEPGRLANGAHLEWVDCWFETHWWRPLHCGRFTTATEAGFERQPFVLPVVYRPAPFWKRAAAPVLYLAGGPGGATGLDADTLPWWQDWFDAVDWSQDIVLYDQRGVGLAEPAYDCPELVRLYREFLAEDVDAARWAALTRAAGERCHQRLLADGVDFRRFDTRRNAADALDLMAVLGFGRYDLYGVSYGTRIGLEMLRQRPEVLRAAVLDSVYPPQVHPELTQPWLLARVLGWIPRICELSDACDAAPARIARNLRRSLERLRRQPLAIEVIDPTDRERLSVSYNADDLFWLLFESLYVWDFIADLPAMLEALADGQPSPALRQMIQYSVSSLLDPEVSDAIAAAVDCRDAAPLSAADYARERARYPDVAVFTEYDFDSGFCRFWRSGDLGADFRRPVRAEVPTLLLAGEFDPVTPPEWAELAAQTLTRASVIEFPGIGHGVLDSDACAVDLVRAFLERPEAPARVACLDRLADQAPGPLREPRQAERPSENASCSDLRPAG